MKATSLDDREPGLAKVENEVGFCKWLVMWALVLMGSLFLLAVFGCSQSLIGGRHVNIYNTMADGNQSDAYMEADSKTSDLLKDILNGNTVPIQGGPGGSIPTGGIGDILNPTPTTPAPAPDPDDSDAPPPAIPGEPGSFLWKPISESNGNLVVLLDANYTGTVLGVEVEGVAGVYSGVANGGREHYRFDQPGGDFPDNASVLVTLLDGTKHVGYVPDTSAKPTISMIAFPI